MSDTPITSSKTGLSRCLPISVPGEYSVTRAWGKASGTNPATDAARELQSALAAWKPHTLGTGPIIKSERGGRMTPVSLCNWFKSVYTAVGLEGCSSHSGRRTFLTKAARRAHWTDLYRSRILHLLKSDANRICQNGLTHFKHLPAHANALTNVGINRVHSFACHSLCRTT